MYIKKGWAYNCKIETINNFKILSTSIKTNLNTTVKIYAIYRSHDYGKTDFIDTLKILLNNNKNQKNHIIVGDFNINIQQHDHISHEFLIILIEHEYMPYFQGITKPSINNPNIDTRIDNIFVKSSIPEVNSYKINNIYLRIIIHSF